MDSEEFERRKLALARDLRASGWPSHEIEERLSMLDAQYEREQTESTISRFQKKVAVPVILGPDGRPLKP